MLPTYGMTPANVRLPPGSMEVLVEAEVGDLILLPVPPALFGLEASIRLEGLVEVGYAESDFGPQRALIARASPCRARTAGLLQTHSPHWFE